MRLLPPVIRRFVADRPAFLDDVARYAAMSDDDLFCTTAVCLRNLERLGDLGAGPDADLRAVLVPELWERLRPGSRDPLRRITTTIAEYRGDTPSIFRLSAGTLARLRDSADDLRLRVASAEALDAEALVERTRFAIAGSRARDSWPPDCPVYEAGFTYRLVPAVAGRVLARSRAGAERRYLWRRTS